MEVIYIDNLIPKKMPTDLCAAIGNFDGIHLGHQKLILDCKKHGLKSALITFYPHPLTFINKVNKYDVLMNLDEKIKFISKFDVDYLILVKFDNEVISKDKFEFMKFLKAMKIKKIVCGYDFSFGYKGLGKTSDLEDNFKTYIIPKYEILGIRVSSSHIKKLILDGKVEEVKSFLGRNYSVTGLVVHGNKVGEQLGYKTANIEYLDYVIPKNGVYFVKVIVGNEIKYGMCNIGNNPTCNYSEEKKLEVHILDFNEIIYGKKLEVEFVSRLRDEKKFSNKEGLINQLDNDLNVCKLKAMSSNI